MFRTVRALAPCFARKTMAWRSRLPFPVELSDWRKRQQTTAIADQCVFQDRVIDRSVIGRPGCKEHEALLVELS
jgi:hypothetical protein